MDCLRPVLVRNPVFKSKRWRVDSEYRELHKDEPTVVERPCGKCLNCRKRYQNEWAFRLQAESAYYPSRTFFATMTYDDAHLHTNYHVTLSDVQHRILVETGDWSLVRSEFPALIRNKAFPCSNSHQAEIRSSCITLDKKVVDDFFKRLRKSGLIFSYFVCGEYGDKFARPHYHIIFYTKDPFTYEEFQKRITPYWPYGDPLEQKVDSINSFIDGIPVCKYVAKYCTKQVGVDYKDAQVPFALMSRRPAIGSKFLNLSQYRQLRENDSFLVYDKAGTPYSLPRYFRNKVFSESERKRLSDQTLALLEQKDLLQARLQGIDLDLFRSRRMAHNRYLEKSYFDKLKLQRFGYDFELCSKTEI